MQFCEIEISFRGFCFHESMNSTLISVHSISAFEMGKKRNAKEWESVELIQFVWWHYAAMNKWKWLDFLLDLLNVDCGNHYWVFMSIFANNDQRHRKTKKRLIISEAKDKCQMKFAQFTIAKWIFMQYFTWQQIIFGLCAWLIISNKCTYAGNACTIERMTKLVSSEWDEWMQWMNQWMNEWVRVHAFDSRAHIEPSNMDKYKLHSREDEVVAYAKH